MKGINVFFFVALHLLISGTGFFGGLCLFSVIRGEAPPVWPYLKLVLIMSTFVFVASMLLVSVKCFFGAFSESGKESSDESNYGKLMKNAFLCLLYFAVGTLVLFMEYKWLL